jgi:hypothetical protein
MVSKFTHTALLSLAVIGGLTVASAYAADAPQGPPDAPKAAVDNPGKVARDNPTQSPLDNPKAKAKAKAAKAAKLGGSYDKLDLTDDQKADILKIRAGVKDDLAKLKAEIKKIQDETAAKELALLTPDQQAKFKALEAENNARKNADPTKAPAKPKDAPASAPAPMLP